MFYAVLVGCLIFANATTGKIATGRNLNGEVLRFHLHQKEDGGGQSSEYNAICKIRRPEPLVKVLKNPIVFKKEVCDSTTCLDYCHHILDFDSSSLRNKDFILSVLVNYSCVDIGSRRMRVFSWLNHSIDISCTQEKGDVRHVKTYDQIVYEPKHRNGWTLFQLQVMCPKVLN